MFDETQEFDRPERNTSLQTPVALPAPLQQGNITLMGTLRIFVGSQTHFLEDLLLT